MSLWIGTSWKMNKDLAQSLDFADRLATSGVTVAAQIKPFVIPPYTVLRDVAARLEGSGVHVGAQNMHWADAGAWTGEISAPMLNDCGVTLVELGHAERRAHFGETNETVSLKVAAAVRHGLTPLVCVGETLSEREAGATETVLGEQIETALQGLPPEQYAAPILLVYEPVWAIGEKGMPASASCANEGLAFISATAERIAGRALPCLYGGSVDAANCEALIEQPHVDGLFIGRSAWEVEGFIDILSRCGSATASPGEPRLSCTS
ncbi:triosephosphate isomerase [Sphingopyxis sp. Root214]|uniref:triose-phosphate isomerase n=1 Tax=unclassified Sphingopyxis TaxID=2614943 RepID=UPI0006FEA000|nr:MULTISPECIES: triose-phosphate isomerase [unclassified Sphingopyxis]KQZ76688.1 triosephosphate isomerase [Sphingopyxis sp. Root154]KRC09425.1 triosephosphate isomerase [Sphingopyxis sp. Root214]